MKNTTFRKIDNNNKKKTVLNVFCHYAWVSIKLTLGLLLNVSSDKELTTTQGRFFREQL